MLPSSGGAQVEVRLDDGLHADAGPLAAALGQPADQGWSGVLAARDRLRRLGLVAGDRAAGLRRDGRVPSGH
jgi:hypothetical protein